MIMKRKGYSFHKKEIVACMFLSKIHNICDIGIIYIFFGIISLIYEMVVDNLMCTEGKPIFPTKNYKIIVCF